MTADTAPRYDPANPLAAIDGETGPALAAFLDYVALGPERSYPKLADIYAGKNRGEYREELPNSKPPTRSKNATTAQKTIEVWGSAHQWQDRLKTHITQQAQRIQQMMEERQADVLARQYQIGADALALAVEALKQGQQFTTTTRRLVKGKPAEGKDPGTPDREIITVRFDGRTAAKFAELGLDLMREATGLDDKAGTPDNPIHTVTESRGEWEQRAAERASAAASTLAEFEDDDPPDSPDEPDGTE